MRTTSIMTAYLTEAELKEAIIQHFMSCGKESLALHMNRNDCSMEWSSSNREESEFVISIDGEVSNDSTERMVK